jgi:hypothetical protein
LATHWSPEHILNYLTEKQTILFIHAAGVNAKRDEEKRRIEKTCIVCNEEAVFNGVCNNCKADQPNKQGKKQRDILNWKGKVFVGDEYEAATTKFKNWCVKNRKLDEYEMFLHNVNV